MAASRSLETINLALIAPLVCPCLPFSLYIDHGYDMLMSPNKGETSTKLFCMVD